MLIFYIQYLKKKDVSKLLALDAKYYQKAYQSNEQTTLARLEINPETDITICKNEDLVGYISLFPIEEKTFWTIRSGQFNEQQVEKDVIETKKMGFYDAYLSSIVIDKERFPAFSGIWLFHYLQAHLLKLRKKGVIIRRIIAFAVSKKGHKILSKMGFKEAKPQIYLYSALHHKVVFLKVKIRYLLYAVLHPSCKLKVKDVNV